MTFQFNLWDKFKELSNLSSRSFSNLVQMVTHLLHRKSLSLSILKVIFGKVNFTPLQFHHSKLILFSPIFLIRLLSLGSWIRPESNSWSRFSWSFLKKPSQKILWIYLAGEYCFYYKKNYISHVDYVQCLASFWFNKGINLNFVMWRHVQDSLSWSKMVCVWPSVSISAYHCVPGSLEFPS